MLKRGFLLLVLFGLVIGAATSYLAWRAILTELPCHWAVLGLRPSSPAACVQTIPLLGRKAWLPAILLGVADLACIVMALFELTRQLGRTRRLRRTLDVTVRQSLPPGLVAPRRLEVVVSTERLCFCLGLFSPVVVLSSQLVEELDLDELEAAIAHEGSHQRRFDPLRLLVASVAMRALFFLPVLRDLGRAARLANELAADDLAIRRFGRRALLRALRTLNGGPRLSPSVSAMANPELLSERLAALGDQQLHVRLHRTRLLLSVVALFVVVGLGVSVPSRTASPRPLPVHRVIVAPLRSR
jgi:hypothetical protein